MASFLQRNGICHNDISLSNIMIDRPSQRLFLIDFADSRLIYSEDQSITSSTLPAAIKSVAPIIAPSPTLPFASPSSNSPFFIIKQNDKKYQYLAIKASDCKDGMKLEKLVHTWLEKTRISFGKQVLKKTMAQYMKGKLPLQSILTLPFFSGTTFSDLIELRGSRNK